MSTIFINDGEFSYTVDQSEAYEWLEEALIGVEAYQGTLRLYLGSEQYAEFCSDVECIVVPGETTEADEDSASESWIMNPSRVGVGYFEVTV